MDQRLLHVQDFLTIKGACIDVRSPAEFNQGHVVGACNIPLFSDEERAQVGTLYKKVGKEQAIIEGLKLVGPKLAKFAALIRDVTSQYSSKETFRIYCWRGGLRSQSFAWLTSLLGIPTVILDGGYKSYRRYVLDRLEKQPQWIVLGGFTGSGKTDILHQLKECGEQILDLEALACHRGSAFGALSDTNQPSNEYFENLLAHELSAMDFSRPIWIEDESRLIGSCKIPNTMFDSIRKSPVIFLNCHRQQRVKRLLTDYEKIGSEALIEATLKLKRRLGGFRTDQVIEWIKEGNLYQAIDAVLDYYDRTYQYSLHKQHHNIVTVDADVFLGSLIQHIIHLKQTFADI